MALSFEDRTIQRAMALVVNAPAFAFWINSVFIIK